MSERTMEEEQYRVVKVLGCLANPIRYQICRWLVDEDELHVSALAEKIGCRPNQVSLNLAKIRDLDLVQYRHEGHFVVYSLKKKAVVEEILRLADELSRPEDETE